MVALQWILCQRFLDSAYALEGAWIFLLAIIAGAVFLVFSILVSFLWWSTTKGNRR
jgi:hypothetical protein